LHLLFALLLFCSLFHIETKAQVPIPKPVNTDTMRVIEIVQGNSLREKTIDAETVIETIAGNVILKEGLTTFYCDSAVINRRTNILEAYGNVHINQNDSIHTYAQELKYYGKERIAYLKKDIKLTDKSGTLLTNDLEYDLSKNIGKYKGGGKVLNRKTVLTSNEGIYYADTHDVYFKKNVDLKDPKYTIKSDSLRYNTQTEIADFIAETYIKSKNGGDIYTNNGTYDLKNGKAFFGNRSVIKDSTRTYVADNSAYDEVSGIAQLEGNAVVKDSVNGYTILGNQIYLNKNNNTFLATRKPILIFKGDGNDSTFIAADTLFSGLKSKDSIGNLTLIGNIDTLQQAMVIDLADSTQKIISANDSTQKKSPISLLSSTTKSANSDTIRYFQAFHHVKIFNDSLQSVCDSLYYSSEDSVFRLFNDPLVFANNAQIAGDTIFIFSKNRKAERVYVFENAILVNKANDMMYNQISGRTINGYFKDGNIDYMRSKGSPAESIFYPQDDDSAYIGMNRSKGDVIDVYFLNKEVHKVKFVNDIDGTLYPIRQIPEDQKFLKKYSWQDARRPKHKLELFE
jgi:lipopolysaccharide export system protein LptA